MTSYGSIHGTNYGKPRSFWGGAARGAVFGGILAVVARPVRRWMLTEIALLFGIIYTVQSPSDYYDSASGDTYGAGGFLGYRFPWYCLILTIAFVVWFPVGYIRALILSRQLTAVGDTPVERFKARMSDRVLIAVDGSQRPPQRPTGPSQRPVAPPPKPKSPKPAPSAPMGSNLPAVWVPTYSGPAKPVQRTETSLSGTVIRDHRGVDPDEL